MRDVARPIDERAGYRFDHVLSMLDSNLTGHDQEQLVLVPVDMERGCEVLGRQQFHNGEAPFRLICGRFEKAQSPVEPEGFPLAGLQPIASGCLWKRHRHSSQGRALVDH
jgi:hypothetical protein